MVAMTEAPYGSWASPIAAARLAAAAVRLGDLAAALEKSGLGEDVGPVEAEWQRVAKALD